MPARLLATAILAVFALTARADEPAPMRATSVQGLYRAGLIPEALPIPINSMQSWVLELTDAAGAAVEGAAIAIDGGMPAHGHGLPTAPQVTDDLGGGRYLIEGLRFSMTGDWALGFDISAAAGEDRVLFHFGI